MTACLWCTLHHRVVGWYIFYLWLWVGTVAGLSYIIHNLDNKATYMHSILIMNDILICNYSILYKRLLPISILPSLQAANLVIRLKILNATITSTLASNIQPSLTSHIWTIFGRNSDNNLSVTMHIVAKNFKLQSFALEPFSLCDLPHNLESISEMWLRVCVQLHGIDNDHMPPDITTDEASNMVAVGHHSSGWFWI